MNSVKPLDHAKEDRLDEIECHGSAPRAAERRGVRPLRNGTAWQDAFGQTCDRSAADYGNGEGRAFNRPAPRAVARRPRFAYKGTLRMSASPRLSVTASRPSISRRVRDGMLTLFHHPFCPHSRFVRLIARGVRPAGAAGRGAGLGAARGISHAQSGRHHAGAGGGRRAAGSGRGDHRRISRRDPRRTLARQFRLLPAEPASRVEVRRLMSWFNDKFFAEVSGPLVTERVYKRYIPAEPRRRPARYRDHAGGAQQYQIPSDLYRLARSHGAIGSPATA